MPSSLKWIASSTILGGGGWEFVRPFLQLIVILVIVDWILGKWGISWQSTSLKISWNVQTVIALIIISAFAIAALGGLREGVGTLKDLALVVVGFYFGTQKSRLKCKLIKAKSQSWKSMKTRLGRKQIRKNSLDLTKNDVTRRAV